LELMKQQRPTLIFLDLLMPVMDGFAFVEQMRTHSEWRSIPIVVVTAADLTGAQRRQLSGSVETILSKAGNTQEDLFNEVRNALNQFETPRFLTPD
ncbi:MAG: response regulator, partial [Longimicrobiales bacterium]